MRSFVSYLCQKDDSDFLLYIVTPYWQDTGWPVFRSVAHVLSLPAFEGTRLLRL
jgi:hypothetical protein